MVRSYLSDPEHNLDTLTDVEGETNLEAFIFWEHNERVTSSLCNCGPVYINLGRTVSKQGQFLQCDNLGTAPWYDSTALSCIAGRGLTDSVLTRGNSASCFAEEWREGTG